MRKQRFKPKNTLNLKRPMILFPILFSLPFLLSQTGCNHTETILSISTLTKPEISPNGEKVVFDVAYKKGEKPHSDIYLLDIPTEEKRRLTCGHLNQSPIWSFDGNKIAYTKITPVNTGIYIMDLESKERRQRWFTSHSLTNGELEILQDLFPSWCPSPHINRIAFVRQIYDKGIISFELCVKELDSPQVKRLAKTRELLFPWNWAWAENGEHIYFIGEDKNIWKVNVSKGEKIKITDSSNIRMIQAYNRNLLYVDTKKFCWMIDPENKEEKKKIAENVCHVTWFPGNKSICYNTLEEVCILNPLTMKKTILEIENTKFPQLLPNEKQVLYLHDKSKKLCLIDIASRGKKILFPD